MTALILSWGVALLMVGAPAVAGSHAVIERLRVADAESQAAAHRSAHGPFQTLLPAGLGVGATVGAIALVARGYSIGWAWFGVAATFALTSALSVRTRRRLEAVAPRGSDHPVSNRRARRLRFRGAMLTGFVLTFAGSYAARAAAAGTEARWDDLADVALDVIGVGFLVAFVVSLARGYWGGDDLDSGESA